MNRWCSFMALLAFLAAPAAGIAADEVFPPRDTLEASIQRGGIAFQHYCSLCHGATGAGNGRAARLYNPPPANLLKTDKDGVYIDLIVRRGGAAIGRSEFMPPWDKELTDEQVRDLVNYIRSISSPAPSK